MSGPRSRAPVARPLAFLAALGLGLALAYLVFRVLSLAREATWQTWSFSILLLAGESFFLLHGFAYAVNIFRGRRHRDAGRPSPPFELPPAAVFVASFNEPVAIVRPTLEAAVAMEYPLKRVYLVDDSTDAETVRALRAACDHLGVAFLHRDSRRGYKAGALNDALRATDAPLLVLLDADQRPGPDFLMDNVPRLLARPDVAYVQTPQLYSNVGDSLVAFAAEVQQTGFYDFTCVGKDVVNALFYLGTNVIIRRSALEAAGGFAEDSVTEDFATSYRLHRKGGWRSAYRTAIGVRGVGPPNLIAYFNQQYRWAFGNVRMLPEILWDVRRQTAFTPAQRFEYLLSVSWWFHGWATAVLLLVPPPILLLGMRVLALDLWAYVAAFVPFFLLSTMLQAAAIRSRGYSARGIFLGQSLMTISFPVSMKACLDAARGRRIPFKVTAKGPGLVYVPFSTLAPQLLLFLLNAAALGWGLWTLVGEPVLAILLFLGVLLLLIAAWAALSHARELAPLRIAQQRAAWRAFQMETAAFLLVTVGFLLGVNLIDVASRTPAILDYFLSQWSVAAASALRMPWVPFTLFWAAYNLFLLHGMFLFRVGTR